MSGSRKHMTVRSTRTSGRRATPGPTDHFWRAPIGWIAVTGVTAVLGLGAVMGGGGLSFGSARSTPPSGPVSSASQDDDGYLDGYWAGPGRARRFGEIVCRGSAHEEVSAPAARSVATHKATACQR